MSGFYPTDFDTNDPEINGPTTMSSNGSDEIDPTITIDWGPSLNKELDRQHRTTDYKFSSSPVYQPQSRLAPLKRSSSSKLTEDQIKKYIEAKCWINGTYLNSLDTEYLVNCKKFASQRLYDKWYWKYFLNLVNEEILNRDVAVGPKRYYPGTEDIPRRGDNSGYGYRSARYRER